jgi:hypothetical protein
LSYKKGVAKGISYQPPPVALPVMTIEADDKAVVNPVKKVELGNAVSEFCRNATDKLVYVELFPPTEFLKYILVIKPDIGKILKSAGS